MKIFKIIGVIIAITIMSFIAGCSKDAMPITANNVQEYFKASNEAVNNVDASLSEVERMKIVARDTLEKMGYDFDATLLSALKNIRNSDDAKLALINEFSYVIDMVNKNPDESVQKGLVSEETKNKLLLFKKYPLISSKEELAEQMKIINLIRQCQLENNNACSIETFFDILVKNGIEQQLSDEQESGKFPAVSSILAPILQNNIVRNKNADVISDGNGLENNFMINDQDFTTLQKDLTNPWWIQ